MQLSNDVYIPLYHQAGSLVIHKTAVMWFVVLVSVIPWKISPCRWADRSKS